MDEAVPGDYAVHAHALQLAVEDAHLAELGVQGRAGLGDVRPQEVQDPALVLVRALQHQAGGAGCRASGVVDGDVADDRLGVVGGRRHLEGHGGGGGVRVIGGQPVHLEVDVPQLGVGVHVDRLVVVAGVDVLPVVHGPLGVGAVVVVEVDAVLGVGPEAAVDEGVPGALGQVDGHPLAHGDA